MAGVKVKVTYANKRRRGLRNNAARLDSSPLEMLPPEKDNIPRPEMERRMLKRSRHAAALAEQIEEERSVYQEPPKKKFQMSRDHVATERTLSPIGIASESEGVGFQTPFQDDRHNSHEQQHDALQQLSQVPPSTRVLSRTSSRNSKENTGVLESPFRSHPGSPQKKRSSNHRQRGTSRVPLRVKSRALSKVFTDNVNRRVSKRSPALSLGSTARHVLTSRATQRQHQKTGPSTSYMRHRVVYHGWSSPPSTPAFFGNKPQFHSTPVLTCSGNSTGLGPAFNGGPPTSSENRIETCDSDTHMTGPTVPNCQTVHVSENSHFSSPGDYTIRPAPIRKAITTSATSITASGNPSQLNLSEDLHLFHDVEKRHLLDTVYISEYTTPLRNPSRCPPASVHDSPAETYQTRKPVVGGRALVLHSSRPPASNIRRALSLGLLSRSQVPRDDRLLAPSSSPARNTEVSTPQIDLAQVMSSLEIGADDWETRSDADQRCSICTTLQSRSHSLGDLVGGSTSHAKNTDASRHKRTSITRALDHMCVQSISVGTDPDSTVPASRMATDLATSLPGVHCIHSATFISPISRPVQSATSTRKRVLCGSRPGSDDELLLTSPWLEDLEYLGLAVPRRWRKVAADELNLIAGKTWCDDKDPPSFHNYWSRRG